MKTQKNRIKYQSQLQRRKAKWGYVFLIPWLLVFAVFYAYPLAYGIIISFTDSKLGSTTYIGLRNYGKILRDYAFWRSLLAMLAYVVIAVPVIVFVPLCAANALRRYGKKFNTAAKLLMYLPGVTCSVALILSWKYMFDPNVGMLRSVLGLFGITKVSVFDSARTAIPIMSLLAACTNFGANLIIYCAALDAIPNDYYEAAELDGASKRRQFTLPLVVDEAGKVYVAAASIVNNSTGDVMVSSVSVTSKNGWEFVPYSTNMAKAKVDAKQVGFKINSSETSKTGDSEVFTLAAPWTVKEADALSINYDAVVSAVSQPVTGQEIMSVVFVLEWA